MMSGIIATPPKSRSVDEASTCSATIQTTHWGRCFPEKVTESYTLSLTFMKQLTTIAFSTITFLRHVFNENNFTTQTFGGMELKILKEKCEDEVAQSGTTALLNAVDALSKKYLDKMVLCLFDGELHPDNLVETYTMSYKYQPAGAGGGAAGPEAEAYARERTEHLLRACVVCAGTSTTHHNLTNLTIRLYYNENAPAQYQAPGYSCALAHGAVEAALRASRRLATVSTRHHALRLLAYRRDDADQDDDNRASTTVIPSFTEEEVNDMRDVMSKSSGLHSTSQGRAQSAPSQGTEDPSSQGLLRCECGQSDVADLMLTCSVCGRQQHAACYGERGARPAHCCMPCARAGLGPMCPQHLPHVHSEHRLRSACIFRRVLAWLQPRSRVCADSLRGALPLPDRVATRVMAALHSHRVIARPDGVQKIEHDHLKILIDSQFRAIENTVVERLEAESQSQGEEPAQEALRPALRSTLQAAGDAGALQPPAPFTPLAQDSTLGKFRKAVRFSEDSDGDLPLSGEHNPVTSIERAGAAVFQFQPYVCGDKKTAKTVKRPPPKFSLATKRSKVMLAQKNKQS